MSAGLWAAEMEDGEAEEEAAFAAPEQGEDPVPRPFAALPDGSAEFHYDLWKLKVPSGASIQCIMVSQVADGRYLAAFPQQVWHRTVSKRTLPAILTKPTLVEVVCASVEDMTEELAFYMKVWVGYITAETYGSMEVQTEEGEPVNYPFLLDDGDGYLPYAPALVEALEERFSFLSAESGVGHGESGLASKQDKALGKRVSDLESLLSKMSSSLDTVLEKVTQPTTKKAKSPKVSFAPGPKDLTARKEAPASGRYPSLDPSVVASALAAGVPEESLQEMERLMGSSARGKAKLREPALRKQSVKKVNPVEEALSESENVSDGEAESGSPGGSSGPATMEGALSKLTELVTLLSADKIKKAKASKVDLALEHLGGTGSTADGSSGSSGKRAAAARRALRLALQESPEEISNVVEKLMLEDLTLQTMMPGMPKKDFSSRAWVEHRSRIGAYKSSAYLAWSASGILDDLVQGRVAHARARAGLMLVMLDQVAIDRGNWALGAEVMLEQGPPLSALASHTLPSIADGESPFSKILDSWLTSRMPKTMCRSGNLWEGRQGKMPTKKVGRQSQNQKRRPRVSPTRPNTTD